MKIKILDYRDRPSEVDVGELNDIERMTMEVGSGDEILNVVYKDGTTKRFDSSNDRTRYFYDGWYDVYDKERGNNIMEKPEWLNRTHYSYLYEFGDTSDADHSDWW